VIGDGRTSGETGRVVAPGSRELVLRVGSALVLVPVAVVTAYLGGWPFAVLWTAAAVVAFWEWTSMVMTNSHERAVTATGMAFLILAVVLAGTGYLPAAVATLATGAVAAAVLSSAARRIWVAAGLAYCWAIGALPVVLRSDLEHGFLAIAFLFAIVWATDTAAYFLGRAIGGAKLMPQLSPKKTWAGAVSGTAAAVVAGVIVGRAAGLTTILALAVLAAILSIFAQAGDLFESYLKRKFGAKDSGHLIPGHGGLMDRLDGFVAAGAIAAVIGLARGGLAHPARGLLVW
jgi:phosphatidate cytidylyltransferase